MTRSCWLAVWGVCALWGAAVRPAAATESAERMALEQKKQSITAEYERRAEVCRQQFVVTACLDKVREERHAALKSVNAQLDALDSDERMRRAQLRKERLADKAEAAASAVGQGGAPSASGSAPAASSPVQAAPHTGRHDGTQPHAQKAATPASHRPPARPSVSERRAQEQGKREAFERRQREIEAHRASVEARNAERARSKPAAQPLPLPASAQRP